MPSGQSCPVGKKTQTLLTRQRKENTFRSHKLLKNIYKISGTLHAYSWPNDNRDKAATAKMQEKSNGYRIDGRVGTQRRA